MRLLGSFGKHRFVVTTVAAGLAAGGWGCGSKGSDTAPNAASTTATTTGAGGASGTVGAGGTGGATVGAGGAGGAPQCTAQSIEKDCGKSDTCRTYGCDNGTCSKTDAPLGTACNIDGGALCDGKGKCVPVAPAEVTVGSLHSCVRFNNGKVKCWGANNGGQLGLGDNKNRGANAADMGAALPYVDLGTGRTALAIRAGDAHTCALLDDHNVKCWGANDKGQLGQGDTMTRGDKANQMGDNLKPIDLGQGHTAKAVAAGPYSATSCAILDDNSLKCWGNNGQGELGQGDTTTRGDKANQLGDNLKPIALGTGRTAVAVQVDSVFGASFVCALLDDKSLKCWGNNKEGNLGLGDTNNRGDKANQMGDALKAIDLGTGHHAVGLGGSFASCVVLEDASAKCWGRNGEGELGHGDMTNIGDKPNQLGDSLKATDLGTGRTALALAAGGGVSCAFLDDKSFKCWGYNGAGQDTCSGKLGQGDNVNRGDKPNQMGDNLKPIDLGTGRTARGAGLGQCHSCALLDDNSVKCWGSNGEGELGLGDTMTRGNKPNQMGDNLKPVSLL